MALPNAIQGALRPTLQITWYETAPNGLPTTPVDLTGATLSGFIESNNVVVAIAGALSVIDGPNGVFRWTLAAADVANTGKMQVQFVASYGTSPTPAKTFIASWTVERALAAT